MSILATCATIALALASAKGGETIELRGECPTVTVAKLYPAPITIDAEGATFALVVRPKAGNVIVRRGTIRATGGPKGASGAGYGALLRGVTDVTLDGVGVTGSKKGLVIDQARNVAVLNSRFYANGEDGMIVTRTAGLTVAGNAFLDSQPEATTCTSAGGVTRGLAKRDCDKLGGTWQDGNHADAVQMYDGVTDATIADNVVVTAGQGITEMGAATSGPLQRITIERNYVRTDGHQITLGTGCVGCVIRFNTVGRFRPDGPKAVVREGSARRCGNTAPDDRVQDGACQ